MVLLQLEVLLLLLLKEMQVINRRGCSLSQGPSESNLMFLQVWGDELPAHIV